MGLVAQQDHHAQVIIPTQQLLCNNLTYVTVLLLSADFLELLEQWYW
jgi:hypothetical protein